MPRLASPSVLLSLGFFASVAQAEPRGIVARVSVGEGVTGTPQTVTLEPASDIEEEVDDIELNDAGTPPDVEAGDGLYSGTTWVEGEVFEVTIVVDGTPRPLGQVEWAPEDEQRDLNITMVGDEITVSAEVKQALPPQPTGAPPGEGEGGTPPEGEGGTPPPAPEGQAGAPSPGPGGGPMALGTGEQPDGAAPQSSALLQVLGLVLGLLALLAVVWWWRAPADDEDGAFAELPEGLSLVPEAGFLGAGTPSLSGGVTVFAVSRAEAPALVGPLLGTLARGRVVVLAAPATLTVPAVLGGPVYRVQGGQPEALKEALAALSRDRGVRTVGLVVAEAFDAAQREALGRGLPAGVGVAVLAIEPAEDLAATAVRVQREGAAPEGAVKYGQCWVFSLAGSLVEAEEGPEGLTRVVDA